jgi:glucose-1-phosphate thymidylyltransferase
MKGIILAGGSGTRLYPLTKSVSKQLLPIYDKPLIYYPLSVLMLSQIRDILIITTPNDHTQFKQLLGDGSQIGCRLSYVIQPSPDGLAQALILAEDFLEGGPCCLVLGDNIFYGQGFKEILLRASNRVSGATVFAYKVNEPEQFGVVELSEGIAVSLAEKPKYPRSNYAITGLYFFDSHASKMARSLKPSIRGELEITDLNQLYLNKEELHVEVFGRGFAWLDTGTHDGLMSAGQFVQTIEKRQGFKIASIEEIAWRNHWISDNELRERGLIQEKNQYGKYLLSLLG